MCGQTYPIVRSASILQAPTSVEPAQGIAIGHILARHSETFTSDTAELLTRRGFEDVRLLTGEQANRPRVTLEAAAVVDFPRLRFTWRQKNLEFRLGVTSWYRSRRAKIWTRIGFIDPVVDNNIVRDFFSDFREVNDTLHLACVNSYNDLISECAVGPLENIYRLYIHVASSNDSGLQRIINDYPEASGDHGPEKLESVVTGIFKREFNVSLERPKGATRFVTSQTFPFVDMALMSWHEDDSRKNNVAIREALKREADAFDDLRCIVVTDTFPDHADLWALVYEKVPRHREGITAPFIVSGELAVSIGSLY